MGGSSLVQEGRVSAIYGIVYFFPLMNFGRPAVVFRLWSGALSGMKVDRKLFTRVNASYCAL